MSRRNHIGQTWILRCLAALLLAGTFGYGPYYLYAQSGFARYLQLRRDLAVVETRNARLRAETERLAREAEALRTNSRAVENVARADLGWVRPGEVVFDLGHGP
jgi:cell division protein FtsB